MASRLMISDERRQESSDLDAAGKAWMTVPMRKLGFIILTGLAAVSLWACQQDNTAVMEKLDQIEKKVTELDKRLGQGGAGAPGAAAARGQQQQQPSQPDPQQVYAVSIDGAPYKGAEHAKITIVDAFEFA